VGTAVKALGWEVVSCDRDMEADIRTDIMDWDHLSHEGEYDFIWASPPCTEYSVAKTVGVRDLDAETRWRCALYRSDTIVSPR
jgi:hypothetical protein